MPCLFVIAGCNGAGKSKYAQAFLPDGVVSFDYDKCYLSHYRSLIPSEFQEEMATNLTVRELESNVSQAIKDKRDFCYETNFDQDPLYWPNLFKSNGYSLQMIFFCLDRLEIAIERVLIRVQSNGHFVHNDVIDYKWKVGYKNLDAHYSLFDSILFVDNSQEASIPSLIVQKSNNSTELFAYQLPDYFPRRLPKLSLELKRSIG